MITGILVCFLVLDGSLGMSSALGNLISYFDGRDFLVRTFIVFCVKIFILCGVDNNLVRNLGCIWLVFEAYGEVSFTTHFGLMFYIYEMFDCSFSLILWFRSIYTLRSAII